MTALKPQELRIGNLIDCKSPIGICPILQLRELYAIVKHSNGTEVDIFYNQAKPILLTEQRLVELGFKKWGRDDMPSTVSYELGILKIATRYFYKDGKVFGWMWEKTEENNPSSWKPKVDIEYVHQLQNLYWCLCGKELQTST